MEKTRWRNFFKRVQNPNKNENDFTNVYILKISSFERNISSFLNISEYPYVEKKGEEGGEKHWKRNLRSVCLHKAKASLAKEYIEIYDSTNALSTLFYSTPQVVSMLYTFPYWYSQMRNLYVYPATHNAVLSIKTKSRNQEKREVLH